jgi:Flp pilus assembly protein TadB
MGPGLRRMWESAGIDFERLGPDLRVVGRPLENHLGAQGVIGLLGLLVPALWSFLMSFAGIHVGLPTLILPSIALGAGGFLAPNLVLRAEAAKRRRAFATAFGTFLDMTSVSLAGGVGVEGSLLDAARIGRGREASVLRAVLEESVWSGETQWAALQELGESLALPDLVEAASTIALAGTEGARVRRSLEAKARAVRARELADAEATAQAATQRMAIPTALLMLGFLLLIGYPALQSIVNQV